MSVDPLDEVRALLAAPEDVDMDGVEASAAGVDGPEGPPPPAADDGDPPEARGARFPLNDIGNGERFRLYFGPDLLRVPRLAWHVWTGTHWARDDDDLEVRGRAQKVSARIGDEILHLAPLTRAEREALQEEDRLQLLLQDEEDIAEQERIKARLAVAATARKRLSTARREHRAWSRTTGNSARIDAMLKEASVALSCPLDQLDADPMAVNCRSGTLRFQVVDARADGGGLTAAVRLDPHRRADRLSKCIPALYDAGAGSPAFDAFLSRVQPSAEMRGFLQRWFGLSMSGLPVQRLAFLWGAGANGKSVLVDLMCRILDDYAATAPIEALTGQSRRSGSDATPELIPLIGARAVRSSEPEQGEKFREGMIKALTSGEPIAVRALHSDFIFVKPFFKLTISGNHKPEIRGTDDGIWRRVLLVPFDVQIPEAERDVELGEKLWAERDGILRWMVEGLLDFLEGGLRVPDQVTAATEGYRKDSDPVGAFLTECTVMDGGDDFMLSKTLIEAFNYWLEENGETRWGGRTVSLRLKDKAGRWKHPASGRGMVPGKQKATGYRGVRLTHTFADAFDSRPSTSGSSGRDSGEMF